MPVHNMTFVVAITVVLPPRQRPPLRRFIRWTHAYLLYASIADLRYRNRQCSALADAYMLFWRWRAVVAWLALPHTITSFCAVPKRTVVSYNLCV